MAINRLATEESYPPLSGRRRSPYDSTRLYGAFLLYLAQATWLTTWTISKSPSKKTHASIMRVREQISRQCTTYLEKLRLWGCVSIEYEGFGDCANWKSSFLCANHPSIFDALLLFQILPQADCVVGTNPWKHPLYSLPAKHASFIPSHPALRMVKATRNVIQEGGNIIVFPEGTRTNAGCLGPFQKGFALAAIKSQATIRTIFIECSSRFLGKNFSLRAPLDLPIRFRICTGEVFHPTGSENISRFSDNLESYFRDHLTRDGDAIRMTQQNPN